ncbi:hypothetical protein A3A49_00830 [Candidatus Curtissbacteria bacterium RIFCSPLOWO2_01_FULL_38_11b]|uniref:DUF4115 domain-containing protein n=1 Tax=Candidatus Curtissbacteria bacterium RIFCSPLOWO2_01_FULL_38_11b TaxID=1797725 RepID=A0A1F5GYX3_9BACT|nr:MAG: hypothetical protein A3A49_00830 [Candidatus Curtissbacteria bacterium RIFCSPLOWO2_01_FULL_38_11b]
MEKFGEILASQRNSKNISLKKASAKLLIKIEHLEALENEDWQNLPEATFTKGYISSYAKFLDLDPKKVLALYRREYDESKYPKKEPLQRSNTRGSLITPSRVRNSLFLLAVVGFILYIVIQYSSIFSSPKLEIIKPPDDITVSLPIVEFSGKVEEESTVSIEGEFVPVDAGGNFSYQYNLDEGQNIIEVIASKRLSPKTKITRTIRLAR